jgi:hypothetical protein
MKIGKKLKFLTLSIFTLSQFTLQATVLEENLNSDRANTFITSLKSVIAKTLDKSGQIAKNVFEKSKEETKFLLNKSRGIAKDIFEKSAEATKVLFNKSRETAKDIYEKSREKTKVFINKSGETAKNILAKSGETAKVLLNKSGEVAKNIFAKSGEKAKSLMADLKKVNISKKTIYKSLGITALVALSVILINCFKRKGSGNNGDTKKFNYSSNWKDKKGQKQSNETIFNKKTKSFETVENVKKDAEEVKKYQDFGRQEETEVKYPSLPQY